MLTNYVGPIGASLIDVYQDETTTIYELAKKVSAEIPSQEDREMFLRAWESDEELTMIPKVSTGKIETTIKAVSTDETVVQAPASGGQLERRVQLERRELY